MSIYSGYDGANTSNKRKPPTGILRAEDAELLPMQRRYLVSGARDINRNYALAGWMIRRHLDYVTTFAFKPCCEDAQANKNLSAFVRRWGQAKHFDICRRHGLARAIRMAEARRLIDGDMFFLKLATGKIQALEGDRIATPQGGVPTELNDMWVHPLVHGIMTDRVGRALAYAVCRRGIYSDVQPGAIGLLIFERLVPARHVFHFGYFERFDQVRGISPLASALNTLRDTYEAFDYTLARLKVEQLFGLVITSNNEDTLGEVSSLTDASGNVEAPGYEVDFGGGPIKLELDPGDDAKFIGADNPSGNAQAFTQSMIALALKSIDLPFCLYSEDFTNYSGSRLALIQYMHAAEIRRQDVRELYDDLTRWRIRIALDRGELPRLPRGQKYAWEWVAKGIPWIDPAKEIDGDLRAIAGGLYTRTQALREQGRDFEQVAAELAREQKIMLALGLNPNAEIPPVNVTEVHSAPA